MHSRVEVKIKETMQRRAAYMAYRIEKEKGLLEQQIINSQRAVSTVHKL